jgi:hypothetical protein
VLHTLLGFCRIELGLLRLEGRNQLGFLGFGLGKENGSEQGLLEIG